MHTSQRIVERVRYELHKRDVAVRRVEPLGAHFVSITFGGSSLAGFESRGFDDHVKFMFVDAGGEVVWRDYTPRRFDADACELTIEFALHGEGKASAWARQAVPGQSATIGGPRGSMIVPADFDWHLLAGDATALPAIRRRLAELPIRVKVIVVAAAAVDDRIVPATDAELDVRWVGSDDELVTAIQDMELPEGEGFAWCAGEAWAMKEIRKHLAEKNLPKGAMRVSAYWKKGVGGHHENLE
ncbi:siderophore-interacting protein [Massilia cavernae]|uniref:Siderophore-interacting protein n=1 Tax=Massilia cavernae TaxID=2320864 RepID=A0A418XAL9_9BURK|nr:siderophore-interacting protein [Massilia cavernae]RJG09393.1 siderophore-interacting protein [Massilia cavernae]